MPQILCTGVTSQTNTRYWGVTVLEFFGGFTHALVLLRTVLLIEDLLRRLVDELNHPTFLLVEVLSESRFCVRHVHSKCMGHEVVPVIYSMRHTYHQDFELGSYPCAPSCCIRSLCIVRQTEESMGGASESSRAPDANYAYT